MRSRHPATSIKETKELLAVLDPYAELWQEWTQCSACFLSEKEIKVIRNYLRSGFHLLSCIELNIPEATAITILRQARSSLIYNYPKFRKWVAEQLFDEHGTVADADNT